MSVLPFAKSSLTGDTGKMAQALRTQPHRCIARLIGKLDLDLRGECNAVKAIMKSLLKQDFNLCVATAHCCREASD